MPTRTKAKKAKPAAALKASAAKPSLAKKARTPNAVRSATTRTKLLDAAVSCLYEVGYHQTSTVLVAERARVSRGAMLHQFPTKADLMMGVADHIRQLRGDLHRERLESLPTPRDRFLALIDTLWEAMLSPSGIARVELMLSSRSDPELADRFRTLDDHLDRIHKELVWVTAANLGLNEEKHRPTIEAFVQLYAGALRGLAIDALRKDSRKGAHAAVALLKRFQIQMLDELLEEAKERL